MTPSFLFLKRISAALEKAGIASLYRHTNVLKGGGKYKKADRGNGRSAADGLNRSTIGVTPFLHLFFRIS
ncbi:hypothetical protein [Desmospora activa]|uniref:Uncharacterized protein n=1 Tax=Desmospora activa DSM 45169 TaxID=1121389 RepID=A0A2T4Z3K6_9BACL|nr:hypothetical protein [Desmospora activa]PTM56473.1 hypothetical protein C8J48_2795 [Desmospora activa DSM 45169]